MPNVRVRRRVRRVHVDVRVHVHEGGVRVRLGASQNLSAQSWLVIVTDDSLFFYHLCPM